MQPQAVWAQMGTIGVTATEEVAARVSKERPDVYFAGALVSGTRQPAENGQLLILASGLANIRCAQFVIRRSVSPWRHRSSDHARRRSDMAAHP